MTSKIEKPVFVSRRAEQQWSRMQAVKLYRNGMSAAEIAGLFDVTPRADPETDEPLLNKKLFLPLVAN